MTDDREAVPSYTRVVRVEDATPDIVGEWIDACEAGEIIGLSRDGVVTVVMVPISEYDRLRAASGQ